MATMTTLGAKIRAAIDNILANAGNGSLTIQNNGASLTASSKVNFRGLNLMGDNSSNLSSDIQLFPNLNPDWYINQSVYPSLGWIWKHTDGYWYFVTMVLSQAESYVGGNSRKFKVYKTQDWITHTEVCSYENISYNMVTPKIVLDSNSNVIVLLNSSTAANTLISVFFDASNFYASTVTANISQNTSNAIETTVSLNVSADNRFGVAFFQKHTGSATYSQLMYVERSAGSGGTWGTPEILGATPLRATTVTSPGAIQLFYTSANEPIIAFLNNASATSSKASIAKKVSGAWTVYDNSLSVLYYAVINTGNNVCMVSGSNYYVFDYANNSYSAVSLCPANSTACAIDSNDNIYALAGSPLSAVGASGLYYCKNNADIFHRAIRPFMQIGAVISANAYSTFGIYTVIPYSRQRLADAWHLVIRCDGAIFMEKI